MLRKIICDKFIHCPAISFGDGLNVIAGDDVASNSIGKTTVLMVLDFIFGGDEYVKQNTDVINHVGHHIIKYIFEFDNKCYHFYRETQNLQEIALCNENFEKIDSLDQKNYSSFLKKHYGCADLGLTFRNIIGRYSRVYGKQNLNERRPLHYFNAEKTESAIETIIKLFDRYTPIQDLESRIKKIYEDAQILKKAAKRNFISNIGATEYKSNKKQILELKKNLNDLKTDISHNPVDIEKEVTESVVKLYRRRNNLHTTKDFLINQLDRIKENPTRRVGDVAYELQRLKGFLPNLNIDKLKSIQEFHVALASALNEEIERSKKDLESRIDETNTQIIEINNEIEATLTLKDNNITMIDKVIETAVEIKRIQSANELYDRKYQLQEDYDNTKDELKNLKPAIMNEISDLINAQMALIIHYIYHGDRKAPKIDLHESAYSFGIEDDTGTGTAFVNLIAFDLAILQLTALPAVIHDLPLLKNIENAAMKSILQLYEQYYKQIFISLDKISSYDCEMVELIQSKTVIALSSEKVLFGMKWNRESNSAEKASP